MKDIFRFYKTADDKWYIDLPDWGGIIDDLQMVMIIYVNYPSSK